MVLLVLLVRDLFVTNVRAVPENPPSIDLASGAFSKKVALPAEALVKNESHSTAVALVMGGNESSHSHHAPLYS